MVRPRCRVNGLVQPSFPGTLQTEFHSAERSPCLVIVSMASSINSYMPSVLLIQWSCSHRGGKPRSQPAGQSGAHLTDRMLLHKLGRCPQVAHMTMSNGAGAIFQLPHVALFWHTRQL